MKISAKWLCSGNAVDGRLTATALVAVLFMVVSAPAFSQDEDVAGDREFISSSEDFQRYEAERLRQQQLRYENERKRQEVQRREQERLEQERVRLEDERIRQEQVRLERESRRQEQLRLENEAFELERAQAASRQQQVASNAAAADPDIYEQLRTIGQLRDDGVLTEQEFINLKKKILE
jgi:hypothetical protein